MFQKLNYHMNCKSASSSKLTDDIFRSYHVYRVVHLVRRTLFVDFLQYKSAPLNEMSTKEDPRPDGAPCTIRPIQCAMFSLTPHPVFPEKGEFNSTKRHMRSTIVVISKSFSCRPISTNLTLRWLKYEAGEVTEKIVALYCYTGKSNWI